MAGDGAEGRAAKAERELKSPVAGEGVKVLGRVGEISPQGVPVVTVANMADQWVVLNVREDKLDKFGVGKEFDGTLPALKGRKVRFKVYRAAVMPDFATWRATRSDQGFDIKTFEVRARPSQVIEGVRPGMSVLVD